MSDTFSNAPGSNVTGEDSPSFPQMVLQQKIVLPKLVLNVGCGYRASQSLHGSFRNPNWREVRLDIDPAVHPDIVCSMTDMHSIEPGTIDAIWSSHNLEHLHRHQVPIALREFMRVLRPGGHMLLTLPDLQRIADLVASDGLEDEA